MKLTGPLPEERPAFPTPWTVDIACGTCVLDAAGDLVFQVDGGESVLGQDRALAQYLVNLVNADNAIPSLDEVKSAPAELLDIMTNYSDPLRKRPAFEVRPGRFLHGDDGTRIGAENAYARTNNFWSLEKDFFPIKILNGPDARCVYYTLEAWNKR